MAKTTAPLFGFKARGSLGKTIVFGSWRGQGYARQHVIPSNPQSAEQSLTRGVFSFLQQTYKFAPAILQNPWAAYIEGKPMTARNAFTKFNLPDLRGESDLANMVFSPGAKGGPAPTAVVATPGSGQLSIAITAPGTVPVGWTLSLYAAAVITDQDPETGTLTTIRADDDAASPIVITGLSATLKRAGGWLVWTRPDGTLAYSPSVQTSATPDA